MKKNVVFLWMACLVFVLASAKPLLRSENYDEELLEPKDTMYNPYAFWLGRPFYEQSDDGGENTYYDLHSKRRSSTISYANVGAGWGR